MSDELKVIESFPSGAEVSDLAHGYNVDVIVDHGRFVAVLDGDGACTCNACAPIAAWCATRAVAIFIRSQPMDRPIAGVIEALEAYPSQYLRRCANTDETVRVSLAIYDRKARELCLVGPGVRARIVNDREDAIYLPSCPPLGWADYETPEGPPPTPPAKPTIIRPVRPGTMVALMTDGHDPFVQAPRTLKAADQGLLAAGGQVPIHVQVSHEVGVVPSVNLDHRSYLRFVT